MAGRNRRRTGDGFSLIELNPILTNVASTIVDELSNQNVEIDQNALFMGLQNIVTSLVRQPNSGMMMASDTKPPYNVAADMLAMGYAKFHTGDKKEAVKNFLVACELSDCDSLMTALLAMNSQSDVNERLTAAEDDSDEDNTEDDADLSDDDISDLIDESEEDADDEENDSVDTEDNSEGDEENEDDNEENEEDNAPMGGASSSKKTVIEKTVTAEVGDRARRILAIKMSSSGDERARNSALKLINKT